MIFLFSINIKSFGAITPESPGDPVTIDGKSYYQLSTLGHLYWFANEVNNQGKTSINAILKKDITINSDDLINRAKAGGDITGIKNWTPIGKDYNTPYLGTFDGNGKTISGLYCKTNSDACLFSALGIQYIYLDQNNGIKYQGKVENLGIKNSYICGTGNVGVVGRNESMITRCYIENCVLKGESGSYLGGIAGRCVGTEAIVENSYSADCTLTADGLCGGGLVGYCHNSGTVKNSYSTNDVDGSSSNKNILIGYVYNGSEVTNCYYLAEEQGTAEDITAVTEAQFKGKATISGGTYDGKTVLEALNTGAGNEVFKQNNRLKSGSHKYLLLSWEKPESEVTLKIPVRVKINYDPSNNLESLVSKDFKHEFFRKIEGGDWKKMLEDKQYFYEVSPVSGSIKINPDGSKTQDFVFNYYIYHAQDNSGNEYKFGFNKNYPVNTYIRQDVGGGKKLYIDYGVWGRE